MTHDVVEKKILLTLVLFAFQDIWIVLRTKM